MSQATPAIGDVFTIPGIYAGAAFVPVTLITPANTRVRVIGGPHSFSGPGSPQTYELEVLTGPLKGQRISVTAGGMTFQHGGTTPEL